jgi:Flp pilus assembly protein TadD
LKTEWQRHVLASSGYLELGMFDDAAMVLEEIAPEDKTRNEVLGARVGIYMAAKKWDMAAAVASHLVKVDPETAGWWISLAYALRRTERVEKAEAILLRAQAIHPKVAIIAFNLACYASVTGRMEEAKERLQRAIKLDNDCVHDRSRYDHSQGVRYLDIRKSTNAALRSLGLQSGVVEEVKAAPIEGRITLRITALFKR